MNLILVPMLLFLQCISVADCLTEEQETHLLKLLQMPRQDNPDSLPLVCDTSDESISNSEVLGRYRLTRDNLKSIDKHAELIRWTTERDPGSQDESDPSEDELFSGFLESLKTFYGIYGLKFGDLGANPPAQVPYSIYKAGSKTYAVGDCIGRGAYGTIRKALCSTEPHEVFAMKIEISGINDSLKKEYFTNQEIQRFHVCQILEKNVNFLFALPELAGLHTKDDLPIAAVEADSLGEWRDGKDNYSAMIMELLGKDVDALFEMCSNLFSTKSIVVVTEQIVKALRLVHDAGYLHRDVKPGNIVVSGNTVKLVDFGMASQFVDNGVYVKPAKTLAGTVPFLPVELLKKLDDCKWEPWFDLESLGHSMLYLWLGRVNEFCDADTAVHLELKSVDPETYCIGCPSEFVKFLKAVRQRSIVPPVIDQAVNNLRPAYDKLLGFLENLKRKLNINHTFQFDWDRKLYRLLKDPEVHKVSYHTWEEGNKLLNYLYVSKYYSEILMEMQNIRESDNMVPLVLDDELTRDAKLMSTNPDNKLKYQNGTVSFTVKVNSLSSWQAIFKALESPYMTQMNEEASSSKRGPDLRKGEGSEVVHHFKNTVREPTNIYVGFGCSHKLVETPEGTRMSEFTLTIVLAPEVVEAAESNPHIMSVAYNKVFNHPIPKQGGTKGFEGTNEVTMMARADLSDEDTVSREILSRAIRHCREKLLEKYPAIMEPNLVGYAYRIDNVKNCTIVAVTMFKCLPDYYYILQELQRIRRNNGLMLYILDSQSGNERGNGKGDRLWYSTNKGIPISSTEGTSRQTIFQDFQTAYLILAHSAMSVTSTVNNMASSSKQSTFIEMIHNPTFVYVRFEKHRDETTGDTTLFIKFGAASAALRDGERVNIDQSLMDVATDSITRNLFQMEDPSQGFLDTPTTVTMFAITNLSNEMAVTRIEFEAAILSLRLALFHGDVVGETDLLILGFSYKIGAKWNKAIVSMTVKRVSAGLPFGPQFYSNMFDQLVEVRSINKNAIKLKVDEELTRNAQLHSRSGVIPKDEIGTITFTIQFKHGDNIYKLFQAEYKVANPTKVRPRGVQASKLSRVVFSRLSKRVQSWIPFLGDSFSKALKKKRYGRIGFGCTYNKETQVFSLVIKLGPN